MTFGTADQRMEQELNGLERDYLKQMWGPAEAPSSGPEMLLEG